MPLEASLRPPHRPNVIVILADDMGFSDLGCTGSEIQTPHLNSIARDGVLFSSMYNCARCCPTRASLLTGLYPHKAGIGHMSANLGREAYQGFLRNDSVTIAEVLGTAGYRTLMSGKWHVGGQFEARDYDSWTPGDLQHQTPLQRGFDRFFGTFDGAGSFFFPHYVMQDEQRVDVDPDSFYMTDAISDAAVEMIEDSANESTPFFLYLAYTAPHWPLQAWGEDIARYEGRYRKGWDATRTARHEQMNHLGVLEQAWQISARDPKARAFSDTPYPDWEDMRMAVYAAQVDRMDQGIGRVLNALQKLNIEDDTLVMFLSDNGGCAEFLAEDVMVSWYPELAPDGARIACGNDANIRPGSGHTFMSYELPWSNVSNAPFRQHKHWVHEGGISTPLLARWPRRFKNLPVCHKARHVVDILPTILQATGVDYPSEFSGHMIQAVDGESLVPVFDGGNGQRDAPIGWEHEGNAAIRRGPWKLVREFGSPWELYNMQDDRTELHNLADAHGVERDALVDLYRGWADSVGVEDWSQIGEVALQSWAGEKD